MKKLLLTGGTGFIGSHLLNKLAESDLEIFAIRRKKSSKPKIILKKNPYWIEKSLNELNINDFKGIDVFVNFASAGVMPKKVCLEEILKTNILDTTNAIELAAKAGVKNIILAGTCYEYGEIDLINQPIKSNTFLNPENFYSASKASSFNFSKNLCKKYNLKMFYGRIFSAYGEGQFDQNLWPSIKKAAKNGDDFNLSNPERILDFIPVEEVVNIFYNACHRKDLVPGKVCLKNIGTGKGEKIIDFVNSEWIKFKAKGKIIIDNNSQKESINNNFISDLEEKFI